ncbi:hypothetical protein GCM10023189_31180 [Nibrella saemangeumensis]|uniref:Tetratricopeptide repeat protein n=1 Tax=Nibrella saemangeumensis TaxID=1084526 RepID=A0ABP8MZ96_9BACT
MKKSILLVLVLATALTAGLYSLPKVVVQNENKQLGGRSSAQTSGSGMVTGDSTSTGGHVGDTGNADLHQEPVTPEQQRRMETLQRQYASAPAAGKSAAASELITFFRSVSRYDSAAHYAEEIAKLEPTEQNWLRSGDQYFEAYGFAVDEQKAAYLGEKTRAAYQKALDKNPNLLAAKANMAMTYVSTQNPMQGITLLREVLQQDPTNELALFNLGLLSMRSGQHTRAIDRFRQILVTSPGNRKAQFYLGISLAEAGQKEEARKVLAQVKTQEKDPQILAAIREYEERLK